jgi:Zn-dependent protease with chaperone function
METLMIAAHFFDGRSARLHPARLEVNAGALTVTAPTFERSYPLAGIALSEPFAGAPAMLRFTDGACCEVAPGAAREQLLAALGYRKSAIVRWQERWPAALLALALLAVLLAALYFRGLPALTERIAANLPASVDVSLGKAALSSLEAQGIVTASRLSDERIAEVQALLPAVLPRQPRMPIKLLVRKSDKLGANALALPDGTIVVTDAMVRLVLDEDQALDDYGKEQLVAVLAHEVGHIEHRHAARVMTGTSLTAALSAALFGDFSAVAAGLPAVLSQMQYSRTMELDADNYALGVLRSQRIPLDAFAEVLSSLERQRPKGSSMPRWLTQSMEYLSTHPDTAARIERIERMQPEEKQTTK